MLSHTPFKSLVPELENKPIMIAGVGQVPEVAHHYGFKHTLTTADVARALPSAAPFWKDKLGNPLLSMHSNAYQVSQ